VIRYALLGVVQGLTEFLPVSSSGHLVLTQRWLGLNPPGVLLEAFLHWGTLGAILWVFHHDVAAWGLAFTPRGSIERRKEIGFVVAGTVPIVIAGLLFRQRMDEVFASLPIVGGGLLLTAVVLFLTARLRSRALRREFQFVDAFLVGLAQALALLPGVSRTGVTIGAGVGRRIAPEPAARFSFLLAIPALLGAGVLNLGEVVAHGGWEGEWAGILVGTTVAFLVGILAIRVLLALVMKARLWIFAFYCLGVGLSALIWAWSA